MLKAMLVDEARHCECGENLSVLRRDWGLAWGCVQCGKSTILETVTRADIEICCRLTGSEPSFICYVLETLRQEDYPSKGLFCSSFRDDEGCLLRYGFPVGRYFPLESEAQQESLHRFCSVAALPLFHTIHNKRWGRGYRKIPLVETKTLLSGDYAQVGDERWAHITAYSDVLNKLRVDQNGVLK